MSQTFTEDLSLPDTELPALRNLRLTVPISTTQILERMIAEGACIPDLISNEGLKRLTNTSWLTDSIMHRYLILLTERFGGQAFDPLMFGDRDTRVRQRKHHELSSILVPINNGGNHWFLVRVDYEKEIFEIQDSSQKTFKHYTKASGIKRLRRYLTYYGKRADCWTIKLLPSEQQIDFFSCGVFTLMNAKAFKFGVPTPPLNEHLMGFRSKILLELMLGRILDMFY
jgi:Ulp1 family protease